MWKVLIRDKRPFVLFSVPIDETVCETTVNQQVLKVRFSLHVIKAVGLGQHVLYFLKGAA